LGEALRRVLTDPDEARRLGDQARAEAIAYFDRRSDALAQVREKLYDLARR
jgi:hypothetical protein